jgi:NitT/TauT family transport system permease protein
MTVTAQTLPVEKARPERRAGFLQSRFFAVLVLILGIVAIWYFGAYVKNGVVQAMLDANTDTVRSPWEYFVATMTQAKPTIPAPHQVAWETIATTLFVNPAKPTSLLFHAFVTLQTTLAGFVTGTLLGILLAVGIVHARSLEKSLMPWIISSQTIPILALAPMVVVVFAAIGVKGLMPKAVISTYLSFFPVTVGMVKGLRSPQPIQLDLLRTYSATASEVFWKLRVPASLPFLFTSMKVGIAASVVGAIVSELPTGAVAGIGAKLLHGSYYSQATAMWSALLVGSILAALLVTAVGVVERIVVKRMGGRPA